MHNDPRAVCDIGGIILALPKRAKSTVPNKNRGETTNIRDRSQAAGQRMDFRIA
jgi:hypothetical protein